MEFFPRELCEKLVKLGCVSESQFVWSYYDEPICSKDATFTIYLTDETPAFIEQDFTGCSERARENAKLLWGMENIDYEISIGPSSGDYSDFDVTYQEAWKYQRRQMIDHEGSAAEFVAKGLEGR